MAKKTKREKHIHTAPVAPGKQEKPLQKSVKRKYGNTDVPNWMAPAVLIITLLAYIPAFSAGFVNLDDDEYVRNNFMLTDFSHLKELLITPVQGNYHPLTMFTLFINYQVSGLNAWSYHLFNIIFHLVNCFLVFRLVLLLTNRNSIIAFTTSLLFGIHPMHVESVAWVSERKDVLYALFFLAGLITYVRYLDSNSRKQYLLTVLFMLLSILSKPAAVIFPLALFSIDFLRSRKLNMKLVLEKTPFFILAIAGGLMTMMGQSEAGATGSANFTLTTKVLFGFYGIMMYIIKMIAPVYLAAFYRYPAANESLSSAYYIAPVFFILLAALFYYSLKNYRVIAFGLLFYVINLLLVLQLIPVGSAVIAERYTYIPYIGLFFIIGWLIDRMTNTRLKTSLTILSPVALILFILTWKQATVWQTPAQLWDNAIKNQPSYKAYANRAVIFREEKNNDKAIEYYTEAIRLNIMDHESYTNRGNVYFDMNKPDMAFKDYKKSLSLKPDYYPALDNMGAQFAMLGQFDSALKYANRAIEIKPDYKPAYSNRALTLMRLNRFQDAIKDWEKFLQFEPGAADVYNMIGTCYYSMGKYQESLPPITKAIEMAKAPEFYLNRSYSYVAMKNMDAARQDVLTAKQLGMKIPDDYAKTVGIQ